MAIESVLDFDSDSDSDDDDLRSVISGVSEGTTVVDTNFGKDRAKDFSSMCYSATSSPAASSASSPPLSPTTTINDNTSADDSSKRVTIPPHGFDLSNPLNRYMWEQRWRRKADELTPSVGEEVLYAYNTTRDAALQRGRQAEERRARHERSPTIRLKRSLRNLRSAVDTTVAACRDRCRNKSYGGDRIWADGRGGWSTKWVGVNA
jgi:hypothetical protein